MIQLNLILGLGRAALCVMTAASTALAAPAFAQQTRTQSFTYNSRGEMITARVVNPAGADLSSSFGYDDVGNLTSTTAPGGLVMQADYDPARRVTEIRRDPNGATRSVSRFDYDVLGRLTRSRAGRVASPNPLTASHWADSSFTYSVDGLLTQATGPDGASIVYDYDPVGRLTRTQDPTGRISGYDYHADGRLKRLYEAVGTSGETAVIDLTYNGIGERERIRQARGIAGNPGVASESATYDTTYQYDAFNRLEQTVYPRPTSLSPHQTESFLYDANGNLEQHTTRRGDVISSSFDASNRLETRTTPEGVYRFEYYLTGEPKISRAPAGQDLEWRTVNNYDFAGRHTVEGQYLVQASGGGAYLIDRVVRYQYDANGNRTRIQWPDGFFVTYLYDAANRLTTICYNSSNCSTNLIARYEYDVQDRATRYTVYGAAGASVVQSDYDYSIDSDLTDLDVSFLRPGSNGQTVSFDYTYDAAGRLTGQDISNADWDWSPAQAGSPLSATYVANPLDQYESVDGQAFTYDLNGNLTAYRGQTLVYSSENRLETLSGAGVEADFSYDAEGRRKRMLVGNTSTEFVHAGTMEIAEYDGDTGALLRRYIPGPGVDQRVLMITCGSSADCAPNQSGADTYAYTADRLGHVIAVTHTRTGAIERYVYSP
ncbi:MAG: RHS repeat protein, partial [Oceanicaulis sp.]|nr:RHS repeat protein [Oceanicaulis sp.]